MSAENTAEMRIPFIVTFFLIVASSSFIVLDVWVKPHLLSINYESIFANMIANLSNASFAFFPNQLFFPINSLTNSTYLASAMCLAISVLCVVSGIIFSRNVGYFRFLASYIGLSLVFSIAILIL